MYGTHPVHNSKLTLHWSSNKSPHLLVNKGSVKHVINVHTKHPLSFHKTIKYEKHVSIKLHVIDEYARKCGARHMAHTL